MRNHDEIVHKFRQLQRGESPIQQGQAEILQWVLADSQDPETCVHTWGIRRQLYSRNTQEAYCIHCGIVQSGVI